MESGNDVPAYSGGLDLGVVSAYHLHVLRPTQPPQIHSQPMRPVHPYRPIKTGIHIRSLSIPYPCTTYSTPDLPLTYKRKQTRRKVQMYAQASYLHCFLLTSTLIQRRLRPSQDTPPGLSPLSTPRAFSPTCSLPVYPFCV